jgi:hypothetical protein
MFPSIFFLIIGVSIIFIDIIYVVFLLLNNYNIFNYLSFFVGAIVVGIIFILWSSGLKNLNINDLLRNNISIYKKIFLIFSLISIILILFAIFDIFIGINFK